MSTVQFQDAEKVPNTEHGLSSTLTAIARSLPEGSVTIRQLFERVGEQGMLMCCIILIIPFLLPVSIPGVSTLFGLLITLIGVGVTLNRVPWLPKRLMDRSIATQQLAPAMEKGAKAFARLERLVKPRLFALTDGTTINRFNGIALIVAAILLMFPFGLVPFSNTLPGLAILFLAAGMLERDGYFIVAGYLTILVTIVYFSVLIGGAVMAGQGIGQALFGGGSAGP